MGTVVVGCDFFVFVWLLLLSVYVPVIVSVMFLQFVIAHDDYYIERVSVYFIFKVDAICLCPMNVACYCPLSPEASRLNVRILRTIRFPAHFSTLLGRQAWAS